MTAPDRLESELPRLLEHLYLGPRPPYADDALRMATASARRTGLPHGGRLLPAIAPLRQPVAASHLPGLALTPVIVACPPLGPGDS
jgi:hypothetical protein